MTQTITRMYGSQDHAMEAVADLKMRGFRDDDIHVVSPPPADAAASTDDIAASIANGYVLKSLARVYADGVRRGGTLVTVHAPFGSARDAIRALDSFDPIDSGVADTEYPRPTWDDAAPLSSALQIPTLCDTATPFSSFWNLRALTTGRASLSSLLGISELADSKSSTMLSDNPAPLSSLLHIPTLLGRG